MKTVLFLSCFSLLISSNLLAMASNKKDAPPKTLEEQMICAADVKTCADGSFVSRDSSKACEFRACPSAPENATKKSQPEPKKP